MRKVQSSLIFLFLVLLSAVSEAGGLSYDCVIKNVYGIDGAGALKASSMQHQFEGNKFSVSRETGRIIGQTLTTDIAKKVRVVNAGSDHNSFKAIAEFEGQIQVVEIQEFKKGAKKPFVATSMGGAGIVSGVCE